MVIIVMKPQAANWLMEIEIKSHGMIYIMTQRT